MTDDDSRRLLEQLLRHLLEQLDKIDDRYTAVEHRYRRFTHRIGFALAILIASNAWMLLVALPHKTDEIQQSRHSVIRQFCRDEQVLVSIVPPGYPPLKRALRQHPDSALNPRRNCTQFAARFVRP